MERQARYLLPDLPEVYLYTLERAIASRFDWRIFTVDGDKNMRFLIEKQVSYEIIRGWSMHTSFRIRGGFQKSKTGDTLLHYEVYGDASAPLFQAAFLVGFLLFFAFLLYSLVLNNPYTENEWIVYVMIGVLLLSCAAYVRYAYYSYQRHLRELSRFMEDFARHNGAKLKRDD